MNRSQSLLWRLCYIWLRPSYFFGACSLFHSISSKVFVVDLMERNTFFFLCVFYVSALVRGESLYCVYLFSMFRDAHHDIVDATTILESCLSNSVDTFCLVFLVIFFFCPCVCSHARILYSDGEYLYTRILVCCIFHYDVHKKINLSYIYACAVSHNIPLVFVVYFWRHGE